MSIVEQQNQSADIGRLDWHRQDAKRPLLPFLFAFVDMMTILAASMLTGVAWHRIGYGDSGDTANFLPLGAACAILFVIIETVSENYAVERFVSAPDNLRKMVQTWHLALLGVLALAFLTQTSDQFSRASALGFYVFGILAMCVLRTTVVTAVARSLATGEIATRRAIAVGDACDIRTFLETRAPHAGLQMTGAIVLPKDPELIEAALTSELAARFAGPVTRQPDDVYVLVPWRETGTIERCVSAARTMPVSVHLASERILERYSDAAVERIGDITSLRLARPPMSVLQCSAKRAFDIFAAIAGLVLLAPPMLAIGALIKLTSPGPALYWQTRSGFTGQHFPIAKFRTMSVMAEGPDMPQTSINDPRITWLGNILRRTNLDELPQLINVLRGQMSIVGPRPHALAHDDDFERRVASYARRRHVKPGITGWAQVNGVRGAVTDDEALRRRLEHDLYYIDNWSFLLDLKIVALTVLSRRAFENAR